MDKDETGSGSKEETASPITPSKPGNKSRHNHAHGEQQSEVVFVLPSDDLIPRKIRNIGNSDLASRLDDHPADVSPPETLMSRVGVKFGVGVAVMSSMTSRPPLDGALNSTGSCDGKAVLKRSRGVVRSVGPQAMVSGSDTQTSNVVVYDAVAMSAEKQGRQGDQLTSISGCCGCKG